MANIHSIIKKAGINEYESKLLVVLYLQV